MLTERDILFFKKSTKDKVTQFNIFVTVKICRDHDGCFRGERKI